MLQGRFFYPSMKKVELRAAYKQKRNELTNAEVAELDQQIFRELCAYDWSKITYLHCYLAMAKFKEYDTMKFIHWIWEHSPHTQIVISKSDFETRQLKHYIFDQDTQLVPNPWGIPEPVDAIEIDTLKIEAVLAPLLVVDEFGNRIGYGKGFYDRFFASCNSSVLRTGISYFSPVALIEDIGEWDVPIELVFTPGKTYCF